MSFPLRAISSLQPSTATNQAATSSSAALPLGAVAVSAPSIIPAVGSATAQAPLNTQRAFLRSARNIFSGISVAIVIAIALPAIAVAVWTKQSLDLTKWSTKKEFYEFCLRQIQSSQDLSQDCNSTLAVGLTKPPLLKRALDLLLEPEPDQVGVGRSQQDLNISMLLPEWLILVGLLALHSGNGIFMDLYRRRYVIYTRFKLFWIRFSSPASRTDIRTSKPPTKQGSQATTSAQNLDDAFGSTSIDRTAEHARRRIEGDTPHEHVSTVMHRLQLKISEPASVRLMVEEVKRRIEDDLPCDIRIKPMYQVPDGTDKIDFKGVVRPVARASYIRKSIASKWLYHYVQGLLHDHRHNLGQGYDGIGLFDPPSNSGSVLYCVIGVDIISGSSPNGNTRLHLKSLFRDMVGRKVRSSLRLVQVEDEELDHDCILDLHTAVCLGIGTNGNSLALSVAKFVTPPIARDRAVLELGLAQIA